MIVLGLFFSTYIFIGECKSGPGGTAVRNAEATIQTRPIWSEFR